MSKPYTANPPTIFSLPPVALIQKLDLDNRMYLSAVFLYLAFGVAVDAAKMNGATKKRDKQDVHRYDSFHVIYLSKWDR